LAWPLFAIILLILVIIILTVYNIIIHRKVETFNNINQKITGLNVLQVFMDILSEDISADEKMQRLNQVLLEKYEINYSTIVIFDGTKYVVKTSNVSGKHWGFLSNLSEEEIFKESIAYANSKYITTKESNEKLPYLKTELERAKSAMFFPLYIDNVYIGYWIIENDVPNAYDNIDTTMLEVVKGNIITILKSVEYQNTIENTIRKDLFTGLYSSEYLYSTGRKKLNEFALSAICMYNIVNLPEINKKINRETGDKVVREVSRIVDEEIKDDYIYIRHMGPKFVIAFGGIDVDSATNYLIDMKKNVESAQILIENTKKTKTKKEVYVNPVLNFAISEYYKGTAIEGVTKKLEEYLDSADKEEADIVII